MEVGLDDYALTGEDRGADGESNIDIESAEVAALLSDNPPTAQGSSAAGHDVWSLNEEPTVPQPTGTN